jgi:PAS domain S-box-containing protein
MAGRLAVVESLIDLAGLQVGSDDFLAAVLQAAAQPIWVVDQDGVIRFANPAAIAALGYDSADELFGRHSHETIHYQHPDGSHYPAADCPMLLPRTTGETVTSELDWFFRRDGSMFPVSYVSVPLPMPSGRGAVVAFTDIEDRLRAERQLRERDEALEEQHAALHRVAALVAGGAPSAEVFSAIASEVAHLLGISLVELSRYEPDGSSTVIGSWSDRPHPFKPGTNWPLDGPGVSRLVRQTGRPARASYADTPGTIAGAARRNGISTGAGAPIVIDGQVWGAMAACGWGPLPEHIEDRLVEFTALLTAAFSNTASRDELARLADEQAALRRVATLVARERQPAEVFAAVAEEVGRLLPVEHSAMLRYEDDGSATVVASWGSPPHALVPGMRMPVEGTATGALEAHMRQMGLGAAVAWAIVVDGRLWGAIVAAQRRPEPLPGDTEPRVAQFTDLIATAISNVQARAELAASRARIVAATDESRRRFERDLHDGVQQRLVSVSLELRGAEALAPPEHEELRAQLAQVGDALQSVLDDLRELSRGIHPAILSEGGLGPALRALGRRSAVPVRMDVDMHERIDERVEVAAYYVTSEALANTAKHARASVAEVHVTAGNGILDLSIRDDGVGGADPARGSGLIGLSDRVEALGGTLALVSPAGGGTSLRVSLPAGRGGDPREPR